MGSCKRGHVECGTPNACAELSVCQFDSGSMTDCLPLCDAPAVHYVTYRNGSYGPFTLAVCDAHLAATRARVWPYVPEVYPNR